MTTIKQRKAELEREIEEKEDNHHLFSLPEIKERIIEVFGKPKTDKEHRIIHQRIWQVYKSLPKFKINKKLHSDFHKEMQYKKGYQEGINFAQVEQRKQDIKEFKEKLGRYWLMGEAELIDHLNKIKMDLMQIREKRKCIYLQEFHGEECCVREAYVNRGDPEAADCPCKDFEEDKK